MSKPGIIKVFNHPPLDPVTGMIVPWGDYISKFNLTTWTWVAYAANHQAVAWGDCYQRKIDAMEAAGNYGPQNWPVEVHNASER